MTLSEYVIAYRETHGLSQRQMAIKCGLSNGYISMLEKNENPKTGRPLVPSIPALEKLAKGLGMTLNELFSAIDDMPVDMSPFVYNENGPITETDDEVVNEIVNIILALSEEKQTAALAYLRFLASQP